MKCADSTVLHAHVFTTHVELQKEKLKVHLGFADRWIHCHHHHYDCLKKDRQAGSVEFSVHRIEKPEHLRSGAEKLKSMIFGIKQINTKRWNNNMSSVLYRKGILKKQCDVLVHIMFGCHSPSRTQTQQHKCIYQNVTIYFKLWDFMNVSC